MSSSNSGTFAQNHSASRPNFQPTDVLFTLPDALRRFDALGFLSTDAFFDDFSGETDATNTYRDHTVDDFDFLYTPQVEPDATEDFWDNGVDYRTTGREYHGIESSTMASSMSTEANALGSVHGSTFDEIILCHLFEGGDDFRFYSNRNGVYALDMALPSYGTHAGKDRQELVDHARLGTRNVYLEPPQIMPPYSSQIYLPKENSEDMQESDFNYLVAEVTLPLNLPLKARLPAHSFRSKNLLRLVRMLRLLPPPSIGHSWTAASSSKTILNQAFEKDHTSDHAVAITNAKFNSFGRIGRYIYNPNPT
ncbi:hypothetical protein EV421DRAFT_2042300 [Armillaria borealis]|uniref:Uncharacterized protein n=1 Tax=Armillaria borealis TaxID=47425 RepID=A0AA39MD62_9AGAR|nr:hypothetical protein EV421DRAFT_2042300 [Armillaria borealis]